MTNAAPLTIPDERPLDEYDDMAFAIRCIERMLTRRLRRAAGLTQETIGSRIGAHQAQIHQWECGYKRPDLRNLDRLVRYGRELRRLAEETGIIAELTEE